MKTDVPIKVFVLLAAGFGADDWNRRYLEGKIVGFNEPYPYGYHRAKEMGCDLNFSVDLSETLIAKFFRLMTRVLAGFDFVHAFRNRNSINAADVVWTHTESQTLAILFLKKIGVVPRSIKVIGQVVWFADSWLGYNSIQKRFFSWLVKEIDVLTAHSPLNVDFLRQIFPDIRSELVHFGITNLVPEFSRMETGARKTVRLVSVGNDRHRDWNTLVNAVKDDPRFELKIVSNSVPSSLLFGVHNVSLVSPCNNDELIELYSWAHVSVVPLRENLHASGITVIQESVLVGLPVVTAWVGGLDSYFGVEELHYYEASNVDSLTNSLLEFLIVSQRELNMRRAALARMQNDLGVQKYVERHVALSQELLSKS